MSNTLEQVVQISVGVWFSSISDITTDVSQRMMSGTRRWYALKCRYITPSFGQWCRADLKVGPLLTRKGTNRFMGAGCGQRYVEDQEE